MAGELYGGVRRLFLGNRPKDGLADTVTVQNQGLDQAFFSLLTIIWGALTSNRRHRRRAKKITSAAQMLLPMRCSAAALTAFI